MNRVKTVKSCFKIKINKNGKMQPGDLTYVIFSNVTRFVILMYCCKCVFKFDLVNFTPLEIIWQSVYLT